MTDKMTVLYVKQTGNVLAAVTRVANPQGEITAQTLAGKGLLVCGFADIDRFEVPPDELEVLTADLNPVALLRPREFWIDLANKPKEVQQFPSGEPQVNSVSLTDNSEVSVEFDKPVQAPTPMVWIQICKDNLTPPRIYSKTVQSGEQTVPITIESLEARDYFILALATSSPPYGKKVTAQ